MSESKALNASVSGSFLLGGTLSVNRLGFGAMRITGTNIWGEPLNRSEAQAVLCEALELGINFIDTADSYGPAVSENIIGKTLYPYPPGLIIATKGGLKRPSPQQWVPDCRPEYLMECVENSLKRLRIECIDLYQLHCIDNRVRLEDSIGALKTMQEQGKIRYIGLSNVSVAEIERAKKIVNIVSVQNHYNLNERESDKVVDYCEKQNLAFIPWYPLAQGNFAHSHKKLNKIAQTKNATPVQVALAWLLKRSPVMLPIPGTSSVAHLRENVAAASLQLTQEEFDFLS